VGFFFWRKKATLKSLKKMVEFPMTLVFGRVGAAGVGESGRNFGIKKK